MVEQIMMYQTNGNKKSVKFKVESNSIHDVLLTIGLPPNLLGYNYISEALNMIMLNPEYLHSITKSLYIDLASKFNTTPSRVERAIRHAINVTWLNGNIESINHIFKNCVNPQKGVPTNSLFLAGIYYFMTNK